MQMNKKGVTGLLAIVSTIVVSVVGIEGGYVDHPNDPGGATNYGITEQVARDYGYEGLMADLPVDVAKDVYTQNYVLNVGFHEVVNVSVGVGHKVIDAGVNTGTTQSAKWLQRAINALSRGGRDYPQIVVDGKVGPATVSAMSALASVRGKTKSCELLLKLMDIQQGHHYMSLKQSDTFLVGWVDHRIQNIPLSSCK